MANVTLRLVKGTPLTNSEVDNNFSNLNITKTEIGGDLGGNVFTPRVTGIQGRAVSNAAPSNAQVLSWSVTSNTWLPSNAVALYSELQTKPAVNVTLTGDVTGGANVLLVNTNTNSLSVNVSYDFDNLDSRFLKLNNPTTQIVTSYIEFQGNVTFAGNVTTIAANNLIIDDNFIYLNANNTSSNDDLGFVGNYNDGIYAHTGFFRDASDNGTWKVFEGYLPEPDAAVNIDTSNASFRLANLAVNSIRANTIEGITNTAVVTNLNADLLDGQHGTYYTNYNNQTNKPAANIQILGIVLGTSNVTLSANTNLISIQTTSNSSANVSYYNVVASNALIGGAIFGTSVYSAGSPVWTAANDGAGSGLDADLLDGQQGTYYLDYNNLTNDPAANIVLTGNLLGSGNAVLTANSTVISISARVANDSVTLGTHTVGRFIANVQQGTAIEVSGGGTEDAVATVSHADTSTLSGLQGGAGISSVTVDGLGHVTAVGTATYLTTPGLNVAFTGDVTGTGNINLTNSSTNSLSIALTVQPNSVALGTDTTGNYVDRVVGGNGISIVGTVDEGNVLTANLTDTGVVASTYGNATIVPVITVDAKGRITSASNVTIAASGGGGATLTSPANNFIVIAGTCSITATGCNNIFIGANAGACTTFGCHNFFAGRCAGFSNTTGGNNNFFGNQAGQSNTTGSDNNFFGRLTGCANTTGSYNNFFGRYAGQNNTTGSCNNFIGRGAGGSNTTGRDNNFFGCSAGYSNTTGSDNNFFGAYAGFRNSTASFNTFIGSNAGACNTTGAYNNFFGRYAGRSNTTGCHNFFAGFCAGLSNTSGCYNNFLGKQVGRSNTSGSDNNFFGNLAGSSNTTGCNNNFFGAFAGCSNTTGNHNTFIGYASGFFNTIGGCNTFIGQCAGYSNTTGSYNNFFGRYVGFCNTTGSHNNFFGRCAGRSNTTGCFNNFFGSRAGRYNTTGNCNFFIGSYAGFRNTTGQCNIFFGNFSGCNSSPNTSGSRNIYIGTNSGANLVTGNDNIVFGCVTGSFANTTSNLIIFGTGDVERLRVENGNLTIQSGNGGVQANNILVGGHVSQIAANVTVASTSETALISFSANVFASAKFLVSATANNERQISEVLVVHNNTRADATEYGMVRTGNVLFTSNVDISASNVRLLVTGNTATSTRYIVSGTLIDI